MTRLSPAVHLDLEEIRLLARGLVVQAVGVGGRTTATAAECSRMVWAAVAHGADPRLGSLSTMLAELEQDL